MQWLSPTKHPGTGTIGDILGSLPRCSHLPAAVALAAKGSQLCPSPKNWTQPPCLEVHALTGGQGDGVVSQRLGHTQAHHFASRWNQFHDVVHVPELHVGSDWSYFSVETTSLLESCPILSSSPHSSSPEHMPSVNQMHLRHCLSFCF